MYDILVIDPPWKKKKGGLRNTRPNQGRELDYSTMDTESIFELLDNDIFCLANQQHVVFMWTIEQFLIECDEQMQQRGYKRHVRMIWNKTNGIAPAFTIRYAHEYLIWYYKPKLLKIAELQRGKHLSIFTEKARQHSRKPDIAYSLINDLYPDSSKIDVFSREKRGGYDQWGNQVDYFKTSIQHEHNIEALNQPCNIYGVSNSVCPKCGDTGRTNPTLSEPDGQECYCS